MKHLIICIEESSLGSRRIHLRAFGSLYGHVSYMKADSFERANSLEIDNGSLSRDGTVRKDLSEDFPMKSSTGPTTASQMPRCCARFKCRRTSPKDKQLRNVFKSNFSPLKPPPTIGQCWCRFVAIVYTFAHSITFYES